MEKSPAVETSRYTELPLKIKIMFLILSTSGVVLGIIYLFNIPLFGWRPLDAAYYLLLIAFYSSAGFLILPARRKDKRRLPWYDLLAATLTFAIATYFFANAWEIRVVGWIPTTPFNFVVSCFFFLLIAEGGRRIGGFTYLIVILVLSFYPLFAPYMPGVLYGTGWRLYWLLPSLVFTHDALLGLPVKVMGDMVLGFLVFAATLIASGAGQFFLDLAQILLGRYRGGPAKVACISSAFFGSLSGSIFSNIIGTGSVTIPMMKRSGFPPHYAGAIEAVASTGGVLMPPVMGAVAFVMAMFLGIEYRVVVVAAILPSILYYFGLLVQIDAYAGKVGLKGLRREEIPSVSKTFKKGWPFITAFLFLVWGLLYMRMEAQTPFYASGILLLLSFISKETMITPKRLMKILVETGILITQSFAIILPLGFIIGGLLITGVSMSFTSGLTSLGGGNTLVVLLLGAIACYVMGMAGLLTPAYIFLAITLAPAVIKLGNLNVLAVHLFILYYSMLSAITPPVAAGAFLAAGLAGASPMRTGFVAMRLGAVIYFIPFFFVYNPGLILEGPILTSLYLMVLALLGVSLLAWGMEGYVSISKLGRTNVLERVVFIIAGLLIAFPESNTTFIGVGLALLGVGTMAFRKHREGVIPSS